MASRPSKPLTDERKPLSRAASSAVKKKTVGKQGKGKTKEWYRKQCDILFSRKVRQLGYCQHCGTSESLQCSHIVTRGVMQLRCDTENALCLCVKCHIYWWHKSPIEAARWFEETWPGRWDRLKEMERNLLGKKVDWEETYLSLS